MASSAKKPHRPAVLREPPAPLVAPPPAPEPVAEIVEAPPVEIVEAAPWIEPVAEVMPEPLAEALPEAPAVQAAIVAAVEAPIAPAIVEPATSVRALLETGVVEARARFALSKTAAEEAAAAVEASYGAAQTGVSLLNLKAMEAMQAGAEAHFDLMSSLAGARSLAELVTLQTEFARKQYEAAASRAKDLAELARKVADETAAPLKAHVAKTFKLAI
jgi:phasin